MNTGQTMLTIMAMSLLSIIIISYFSSLGQSGRTFIQSNSAITATTIATSFIERAMNTEFDESTENGASWDSIRDSTDYYLTSPASLGVEIDDILHVDSLDDFDDFNYFDSTNVLEIQPAGISDIYRVEFKVYYVDTSNINSDFGVNKRTYLKKMDVKVYRKDSAFVDEGLDAIRLSTVYGYFKTN